MELYFNVDKIITFSVIEPYVNSGEVWDTEPSHGYIVKITTGYTIEGYSIFYDINCNDENHVNCIIRNISSTVRLLRIEQ